MEKILFCVVLVLAIIFVVPFLVYGLATRVAGLKEPEGISPSRFLLSVLVSKTGTAIAFVFIFYVARGALSGQWFLYAFLWWLLFLTDEIGQVMGKKYSRMEAVAGILSESIYLPLSAFLTDWMLGLR